MFESFHIIGYDELYFKEKIMKEVSKLYNDKENEYLYARDIEIIQLNKFCCRNLPILLSSIISDFAGPILNGNKIIENIFPIPPEIIIGPEGEDLPAKKKNSFIIFNNIQNEVVNYGYGHIFYEKKIYKEMVIHIPKAFVIISQFPFFKIFIELYKEIFEIFLYIIQ